MEEERGLRQAGVAFAALNCTSSLLPRSGAWRYGGASGLSGGAGTGCCLGLFRTNTRCCPTTTRVLTDV